MTCAIASPYSGIRHVAVRPSNRSNLFDMSSIDMTIDDVRLTRFVGDDDEHTESSFTSPIVVRALLRPDLYVLNVVLSTLFVFVAIALSIFPFSLFLLFFSPFLFLFSPFLSFVPLFLSSVLPVFFFFPRRSPFKNRCHNRLISRNFINFSSYIRLGNRLSIA